MNDGSCGDAIWVYNIVATFTTTMNTTFWIEMDNFVVEYINDILIFSKSLEEHTKHIE